MHIPAAGIVSICLILSMCLVSGSSVMVIVFEQSDRTALIPEAIIYADGKIAGKTDLNGAFNLSFEGYHPNIRVAKGGYTDWTGTFAENDTAILVPLQVRNSTLFVEVFDADTLIPVQNAHIIATSEDGSREDGYTGPEGKIQLALRSDKVYNLEITAQNFQVVHDTIVTSGDSSTVQYSLVRNDRISIRVLDSLSGYPVTSAHVQIDGTKAGITNDRGVLISNTSRNVEHIFDISAEGYESTHLARSISFEDQVVDIPLVKAKTTIFVSVYNKDQMPLSKSRVKMDGSLQGVTNEFGRIMIPSLEMKPYEFTVTRDGYKENMVSFTPGNETSDLIIVLESEFVDLEVLAQNSNGNPLSNVSVYLLGENQEPLNTNETGFDGICVLPAIEEKSYRIKAEKGGYYPNTTTASTKTNPNHIILHTPDTIQSVSSSGEIPWFYGIGVVVLIVAGVGVYLILSKRNRPYRRGRSNRRRSL